MPTDMIGEAVSWPRYKVHFFEFDMTALQPVLCRRMHELMSWKLCCTALARHGRGLNGFKGGKSVEAYEMGPVLVGLGSS
jgi:hypothetical protein